VVKQSRGRKVPEQLRNPHPFPEELEYLYVWYNTEVGQSRPLEWADLYHWSRVAVRPITGFEAEALRAIDRTFWRIQRDGGNQPPKD
jgi:hypothetical protein